MRVLVVILAGFGIEIRAWGIRMCRPAIEEMKGVYK